MVNESCKPASPPGARAGKLPATPTLHVHTNPCRPVQSQAMTQPVARARTLPLYIQISELLTREIAAGHWADGARLPTEADLAGKLGVAVGTLRKALADLESRGMLERRQGSGTYVRVQPQGRSIYDLFRLELNSGGGLPTAQVLALERGPAPLAGLGEPPSGAGEVAGDMVVDSYRVRRLRYLNRVPIAVEEAWFAAAHADAHFGRALGIADLHESLYYFYQQDLGFWIAQVEDHIGLGRVPDWAPADFAPAPGAPVCQVERRSWSATGALEEYSRTWFDADRARYTARWR